MSLFQENQGILTDEQVPTLLDQYKTMPTGADRDLIGEQLLNWNESLKAKKNFEAELQDEQIFSDLGAARQRAGNIPALDMVADPDDIVAGAANQNFVARQLGKTREEVAAIWPSYRTAYSKQALGKEAKDDKELFGLIGGQVALRKATRDANEGLLGDAVANAIDDLIKGQHVSTPARVAGFMAKYPEAFAGQDQAALMAHYSTVYNGLQEKIAPYRDDIAKTLEVLKGWTGEENSGIDINHVKELANNFAHMPRQDRNAVYEGVALAAKSQNLGADKGFALKLMESFGRGISDMTGKTGMAAQEAELLRRIDVAEGKDPFSVSRSEDGKVLVQSSLPGGSFALSSPKQATEADREQIVAESQEALKQLTVLRELKNIADGSVDPIRSDASGLGGSFINGLYGAARSAPYTLTAAIPAVGPALTGVAIWGGEVDRMALAYPDMDPTARMKFAAASAAMQAPIEWIKSKALFGKLPATTAFLKKISDVRLPALARISVAVGGNVVEQNLEETVQDGIPLVLDTLASTIREDMPEFNAEQAFRGYTESRWDTFFALLPMAMIGGGASTYQEVKRGAIYTKDLTTLRKAGLSEKVATDIAAEPDPAKRDEMIHKEWPNRTDEDIAAGVDMQNREIDKAKDSQESPDEPTMTSRVILGEPDQDGNPAREWTVTDARGKVVVTTRDVAAAEFAMEDERKRQFLSANSGIGEAAAYIKSVNEAVGRGEDIQKLLTEQAPRSLLAEYNANPTPATLDRLFETVRYFGDEISDESELAEYFVRASNRGAIKDGVYRSIIRVHEGTDTDGIHVMRDFAQDNMKRAIAEGDTSIEWVREQLAGLTGTKGFEGLRLDTDTDVIESFSDVAVAYFHGRIKDESIPAKLRVFLRQLAAFMKQIFVRSYHLKRAIADGQVGENFEQFLAQSVGLDADQIVNRLAEKEQRQMFQEAMDSVNEGDGALGGELLDVLAGAKLPDSKSPFWNEDFARTKEAVQEFNKGKKASEKIKISSLFSNDAIDPDLNIVGVLAENGFDFFTVDDLVQAVQDRVASGRPAFGTRANDDFAGADYSISKAQDARYLELAKDPEEAAKNDGFTSGPWFHGGQDDLSEYGFSQNANNRGHLGSVYLFKDSEAAEMYALGGGIDNNLSIEEYRVKSAEEGIDAMLSEVMAKTSSPLDLTKINKPDIRDLFDSRNEAEIIINKTSLDTERAIMEATDDYSETLDDDVFWKIVEDSLGDSFIEYDNSSLKETPFLKAALQTGLLKRFMERNQHDSIVYYDAEAESVVMVLPNTAQARITRLNGKPVEIVNYSIARTPADSRYLELAKDPEANKDELQAVDEAAKQAGWTQRGFRGQRAETTTIKGSDDGRTLSKPVIWVTTSEPAAALYNKNVAPLFVKITNPAELSAGGMTKMQFGLEDAINDAIAEGRDGLIVSDIIDVPDDVEDGLYNSEMRELGYAGDLLIAFDSTQVKSAAPVTRDESGNVIPLSARFNPESDNINYSISKAGENRVEKAMEAHLKRSPDARLAIYKAAKKKFNEVREKRGTSTDPNEKFASLLQSMGELKSILSVLPKDVRGKIEGYMTLANLGKDTKTGNRQTTIDKFLEKRIEMIGKELERVLRKEYDDKLFKLFARAVPAKDEAGKKRVGKAGEEIHHLFDVLKQAVKWDADTVLEQMAGREARTAKGDMTPEAEDNLRLEIEMINQIGNWDEADAARRAEAVGNATYLWDRGYLAYQTEKFIKREKMRAISDSLGNATGKKGVDSELDQQEEKDAGRLAWFRKSALSLNSFDHTMRYIFGDKSKEALAIIDAERKAANQKDDAIFEKMDALDVLFTKLAGSGLKGEQLRYDMGQKSIVVGEEQSAAGIVTKEGRHLSQLEAIAATLMWRQDDGRRHMEGQHDEMGNLISKWSYDQDFIDEVESKLSREARAVREHLIAQYDAEYAKLNPVYKKLYGINLPQNAFYSPITVDPATASGNQAIDPVTGTTMSSGSLTPGSLRTRGTAIAKPNFRDALQTYIAHTKQIQHWMAYAEFGMETRSILMGRDISDQIAASAGQAGLKVMRGWLDYFNQGGTRDAGAHLDLNEVFNRAMGRAASMAIVGRAGTIAIQATQLGAAQAEMSTGAYTSRLVRLLSGNLGWGDSIKSPYIQRRMKEMPPVVRQAMDGLSQSKPNAIKHFVQKLGSLISGADALFTAGTYAIVLDYQTKQAIGAGMSGKEAADFAKNEAERIVDTLAQPTRAGARSLYENTSTNPMAKLGWAFASESRKNLALAIYAVAKRSPIEKARALAYVVLINAGMAAVLRAAWRDLRDDSDDEIFDEKHWGLKRMAIAIAADPLYGMPGLGDALQGAIYKAAGEWHPSGDLFSALENSVPAIMRLPETLTGQSDMKQALKDAESILTGAGLFSPTVAATASLSHIARDIYGVTENATSDD
jgi:hypothetical protein